LKMSPPMLKVTVPSRVKNFIFRMEVHRCCCAWRRDIFHNCIAAIHLCSVNPNAQLFSGDCLKPFDGVMVTDNRCTLFECMISTKLRIELVGIIHQNFSFEYLQKTVSASAIS
jgi:hypothetical protein